MHRRYLGRGRALRLALRFEVGPQFFEFGSLAGDFGALDGDLQLGRPQFVFHFLFELRGFFAVLGDHFVGVEQLVDLGIALGFGSGRRVVLPAAS